MSKYEPLRHHLQRVNADAVAMTFSEIEKVLGFDLPKSKAYPAWWSNNPTNNVMTNEWLAASYKTEQVDIANEKLVFRRASAASVAPEGEVDDGRKARPGRHPLFGWMAGTVTVPEGVDLTEPADPDWAEIAWGEQSRATRSRDRKSA